MEVKFKWNKNGALMDDHGTNIDCHDWKDSVHINEEKEENVPEKLTPPKNST